jgi:sulfite exporter TauE/SafE
VSGRLATATALVGGIAALVLAVLAGWNEALLDAIVTPPTIVRALLIAVCTVLGVALLGAAAGRISAAGGREHPERDLPGMIRGIRLVFLAVAAFAAAAGWLLASPLPLIVAVVIAAIDVIETSFLLLVVTVRGDRS